MNASAEEEKLRDSAAHYHALFHATMTPHLVLAPDAPRFTITDVNRAYLHATMTESRALLGRGVFEAFPDNPDDMGATGVEALRASLYRALASGRPDSMAVQKYDIRRPDGSFEERHWSPVNTPILDASGKAIGIIHHVVDVTEYVHLRARGAESDRLELEVVAVGHRLQHANERLRESEERHRFQLLLIDTLRQIAEPLRIKQEAVRMLGEQIGASRVAYFEVTDTHYLVENDFVAGVPSIAGSHAIESFGTRLLEPTGAAGLLLAETSKPNLDFPQRSAKVSLGSKFALM